MAADHDEFPEPEENKATVIVRDTKAADQARRAQAKEAQARYKAIVERERQAAQAAERQRVQQAKLELAKMRIQQSATEKARAHIAVAGPLYLLILVTLFLALMMTGAVNQDQISVASVLITTIITMIGSNLRSVLSEGEPENGNGHDKPKKSKPKVEPTAPEGD